MHTRLDPTYPYVSVLVVTTDVSDLWLFTLRKTPKLFLHWHGFCRYLYVAVQAAINGEVVGTFDSYPGSVFNALDIQESDVQTLTLTSIGIDDDQWTSLLEVSAVPRNILPGSFGEEQL